MFQIQLPELLVGTLVLALVASRFPRIWFNRDGRVRPIYGALSWAVAILVILQSLLTIALNDDEVFYLARSWGVHLGEPSNGDMPMRIYPMLTYFWAGLSPSGTVWLSRISMVMIALVCGLIVRSILKRLDPTRTTATVAGAITVVMMADLPMVVLRPEYIACLLGLTSLSLLVTSPGRAPGPTRLVLAGVAIGLAMTTSIRQIWLAPAAALALHIGHPVETRRRAHTWALAGFCIGVVPTALYFVTRGSLASLWYWNVVFPRVVGWTSIVWVEYPLLVASAAVGLGIVLRAKDASSGLKTVAVFWAFSSAANVLVPFSLWYALGIWHATGLVLTAAGLTSRTKGGLDPRQMRIYVLLLGVLAVPPTVLALRPSIPPRRGIVAFHEFIGQLHLIDWLGRVAGNGPVMCVAPYHPMRVSNAWRMTNAWWYLRLEDPGINLRVNGDIANRLESGAARIIEWNTFSSQGGKAENILRQAVATRVITSERAGEVARRLVGQYRLVEWKALLPRAYGGGRFLVRRDIATDSLVSELPDSLILGALSTEGIAARSP